MANRQADPDAVDPQAETPPGESINAVVASRKNTDERAPTTSAASTTSAPSLLKRQPSNTFGQQSPSAGTSPRTSRTTSPVRKDNRPQPLSNPSTSHPSAAAIQRALSAANAPQLQAGGVSDGVSRLPRATSSAGGSGDSTPRWPISPRLKSPPPSGSSSRRGSSATQKKPETAAAPAINVESATPQSPTPPPTKQGVDETSKGPQLQTPAKAPLRGPSGKSTLETVQENSTDDNRELAPAAARVSADLRPLTKISDDEASPSKRDAAGENEKHTQHGESGSESAGTKSDKKKEQNNTVQRPRNTQTKSYTPLSTTKSRQEGKQGMTVETEIVQSIPQSALNAGDRSNNRNDNSGSVRLKPSNETIRPKKERKKPTQKARSLNQGAGTSIFLRSPLLTQQTYFQCDESETDGTAGDQPSRSSSAVRATSSQSLSNLDNTIRHSSISRIFKHSLSFRKKTISNRNLRKASSKADIFEARVANAVDEANSSDSDETFVYESNPPEPQRRPGRHHSRTPSVTSSHSIADGQSSRGIRNYGDALEDKRVAGKRSMKFSNNAYNDIDSPDTIDGSVRSHTPRHFGRFGRGGSQASMFDPDSPFTQASKLRANQLGSRNSRPNSPRSGPGTPQQQRGTSSLFGRRATKESSYDFDAEGGDENERTPLMGSVRTPRSGRLHRRITTTSNVNSIDEYYGVRRNPRCGRFGGCCLFLVVLAAVIVSAIAFLFMSNRPLYDVRVCRIENVLASEQELMLDLVVGAVNPNALDITIDNMNVDLFARSKHIGSGSGDEEEEMRLEPNFRRKRRRSQPPLLNPPSGNWQDYSSHWRAPSASGGVDEGTDPPDDDDLEKDAHTLLLGRISKFDQGLFFQGSPVKRHTHISTGELRLDKPGNKTEIDGSERWEKVLHYEFELIVRGVLKYQLPISSRLENVKINSSIKIYPDDEEGDTDPEFLRKWRVVADQCELEPEPQPDVKTKTKTKGRRLWYGWS